MRALGQFPPGKEHGGEEGPEEKIRHDKTSDKRHTVPLSVANEFATVPVCFQSWAKSSRTCKSFVKAARGSQGQDGGSPDDLLDMMMKMNQIVLHQKAQGDRIAISQSAQGPEALFRDALHDFTQQFVLSAPVFQENAPRGFVRTDSPAWYREANG